MLGVYGSGWSWTYPRLRHSSPPGLYDGISQNLGTTNGVERDHVTHLEKNIKFYYCIKMNSDKLWPRIFNLLISKDETGDI